MSSTEAVRWKPNWPAIVIVAAIVLVAVFGVRWYHQRQVQRTTQRILARAQSAEQAAEESRSRGDDEAYAEHLAEAVRSYDEYLRYHPRDLEAQRGVALAVYAQWRRSPVSSDLARHAYQLLNRASIRDPDDLELLSALADTALRLQRWDEAASHLQSLVERDSEETEYRLDLARCYLALRQERKAAETLEAAIQADPGLLDAYLLLARTYRSEAIGDTAIARETIDRMVEANVDRPEARAKRATYWLWVAETTNNRLERSAAWDHAAADYEAVHEEIPRNLDCLLVGFALALRGDDAEQAEAMLFRVKEADADDQRVLAARVELARYTGDEKAAAEALSQLARQNPERLAELAESHLARVPPDVEAAREVLVQMQEAGFRREVLTLWSARIRAARGEVLEAARVLENLWLQTARLPELRLDVGLALAECFGRMNWWDRALGVYNVLLRERATSLPVLANRAVALYHLNRYADALAEFERLELQQGQASLANQPTVAAAMIRSQIETMSRRHPAQRDWQAVAQRIDELETAGTLPPEQMAVLRAEYLAATGQVDEALLRLDDMLGKLDTSAKAGSGETVNALFVAKARILAGVGRTEEAYQVLEAAVGEVGQAATLRAAQVAVVARMAPAQAAERLEALEQAAEQLAETDRQPVLRALAGVYLRRGNVDRAERLWEQLTQLAPSDLETRRLLLELARQRGDTETVKRRAAALQQAAGDSSALGVYAEAVEAIAEAETTDDTADRAKQLDRASQLLARVDELLPGWGESQRLLGDVHLLRGELDAAIDAYLAVHREGMLAARTTERLVRLLFVRGRFDEARSVLRSLPEAQLSSSLKRIDAELLLRQGDAATAVARAAEGIGDAPAPLSLLWYGQLLVRVQRLEEAAEVFARLTEMAAAWPDAWIARITVLAQLGRRDEARRVLSEAEGHLSGNDAARVSALGWDLLGNASQAEQHYRKWLEQSEGDLDVLRRLAQFYRRYGRLDEAERHLRTVLRQARRSGAGDRELLRDTRRDLALVLAGLGDYQRYREALELLAENEAEAEDPRDVILKARVMATRSERAARQKALTLYEAAADDSGSLPAEDQYRLAVLYESLDRWADCRVRMLALLESHPDNVQFLATFARLLIDHNAPREEVEGYLERLDQLVPDATGTVALRARLAIRDGRLPEALEALEAMIDAAPAEDRYQAILASAELLEELKQHDAAEDFLVRLAERSPQGKLQLSAYLGRRGRVDEALDLCDEAGEQLPAVAVLGTAVGIVKDTRQLTEGQQERVESWIARAREEAPRNKAVQLQHANYLRQLGRYETLIDMYQQILGRDDLSPTETAVVKNNLAYALAALNRSLPEARWHLEAAKNQLGPLGDLLDTQAVIELRSGNTAEAVTVARQAVAESDTPLARYHLVQALWSAGEKEAAIRELEQMRREHHFNRLDIPVPEREEFDSLIQAISAETPPAAQ